MEANIKDLVKLSPSIDKLWGSRTSCRDGECFYPLPDSEKKELEKLDKDTGETNYYVVKGNQAIRDLWSDMIEEENKDNEDDELDFGDFKVYWRGYNNLYMNAREVILPTAKEIVKQKAKRIYVIQYNYKLLLFPSLYYPKAVSPFLKWVKKNKRIDFKALCGSAGRDGKLQILNFKTIEEITKHADYLENEYYPKEGWSDPEYIQELRNPISITTLRQGDIDEYILEANNRYEVKR